MHLERYGMLIQIWLIHLIPLLLLAVPVWYVGRKRVKWSGWDFAITVGPFAVWGALMMYDDSGKSLSNVLEALIIGVVAPIAPVVRVAAGEKMNQKRGALALLSVMCVVAFSLWALMPSLPE